MKYGVNQMHTNYFHNKWGGLIVNELDSILEVQGSNLKSDMSCGQWWSVD